jgi:hypothetical protein
MPEGKQSLMNTPNEYVRTLAQSYVWRQSLAPVIEGHYVSVSPETGRAIAAEFDLLPTYSIDAREAYRRMAAEVVQQYRYAEAAGIRFEPWTAEGQPYQNSAEMCADVQDNRHLYFFTGGEPHPFLGERSGIGDLTYNDCFRAIHDLFGHAAEGYQFGPRGEENAWIHHSQMFTELAQRALTTETRGQNSWVNFGPQSHLPVTERPYAEQKAALLPAWVADWRKCLAEQE